jgi:hypothetical protein
MEISALLVGLAIMILAAAFVFSPFQKTHAQGSLGNISEAGNVEKHKREALAALRDLDFDFRTGKVSQEDYTPLRAQLLMRAALLVEAQDREEAQVEALIHNRRQILEKQRPADQPQPSPSGEQNHFCHHCGARTVPGGLYCPRCGGRLVKEGEVNIIASLTESE